MDAHELRTGNWIRFKPDQVDFIVNEISVYSIHKINGLGAEYIIPIPLSEDWLEGFGFVEVYNSNFTKRYDLEVDPRFDYLINKQSSRLSGVRFKGNTLYDEVKYVHQLQNLYFALTGKELTINQNVEK